MNYREIVDYIEEIPKFTSKNPLDHTKALLKCLGDPQNQMQVIRKTLGMEPEDVIIPVSALKKTGVDKVLDAMETIIGAE